MNHPADVARLPSPRRPHVPPGERGAMAILSAFGIWLGFILLGGVVLGGFLVNHAQQNRNLSDAYTAAWGLYALDNPRQSWQAAPLDFSSLARTQGFSEATDVSNSLVLPPRRINYADQENRYTPGYLCLTSSAKMPSWFLGLTNAWPSFGTSMTRPLAARSAVRVNQLTFTAVTLYRQRVMLMMDFSRTMDLNYTGKNGTQGITATEALKNVATSLLADSVDVYDVGLMAFSDGRDSDASGNAATSMERPAGGSTFEEDKNLRDQLSHQVRAWRTRGNGTNIEDAINRAAEAIESPAYDSLILQKPMMIIITDGEPNVSSSVAVGTSLPLPQVHQTAGSDARNAMAGQWNKKNSKGGVTHVDSLVFQIQREGDTNMQGPDREFLESIAGANGKPDSNYFYQDHGDPESITRILQQMPKYPVCTAAVVKGSQAEADLRRFDVANPNGTTDVMRAFVSFITQGGETSEIRVPNVFIDAPANWSAWATNGDNAAYLSTGQNGGNLIDPTRSGVTGLDVLINNPRILGIHYETSTGRIEMSPALCAAMSLSSIRDRTPVSLSLRWGYPAAVDPNSCVIGPLQ